MAVIKLNFPTTEKEIRKLKVGDEVLLSGRIITGRDAAHKWMVEKHPKEVADVLKEGCIYHCGPIVKKHKDGSYSFVAAGPTTSIREEPYTPEVLRHYKVRAAIGKGGLAGGTLAACNKYGAVYLHAIGGLAAELAKCVVNVADVYKLAEFGVPEAMWVLDVVDFPTVVTMDSHNKSLHILIEKSSGKVHHKLIGV